MGTISIETIKARMATVSIETMKERMAIMMLYQDILDDNDRIAQMICDITAMHINLVGKNKQIENMKCCGNCKHYWPSRAVYDSCHEKPSAGGYESTFGSRMCESWEMRK